MLNKVPQITLFFWIIKVLATTVGETLADFLNTKLGLGLINTSYALGALFLVALAVQLMRKRYIPAVYWTVVVLISVVGTLVSDTLVDKLGFGLRTTTIAFACVLGVVFVLWYLSEKTLAVHWIATTRRELFYWCAILFTFALGTSAGDLLTERVGTGYALGALMFAGLIAWCRMRKNAAAPSAPRICVATRKAAATARSALRWVICSRSHAPTAGSAWARRLRARSSCS